jgi:hypothetical protein
MKPFLLVFIIIALSNSCFSQILNSKDQAELTSTKFIRVYEFDRSSHNCSDKKNIPIILFNRIVSCFRFKKKLDIRYTQQIIGILSNRSSFKQQSSVCFTSDFGMILFDDKQKMIGSITTSLNCDNLSFNNSPPIKLTRKAKNRLLKIIR